jgi:hypothetical protein
MRVHIECTDFQDAVDDDDDESRIASEDGLRYKKYSVVLGMYVAMESEVQMMNSGLSDCAPMSEMNLNYKSVCALYFFSP